VKKLLILVVVVAVAGFAFSKLSGRNSDI